MFYCFLSFPFIHVPGKTMLFSKYLFLATSGNLSECWTCYHFLTGSFAKNKDPIIVINFTNAFDFTMAHKREFSKKKKKKKNSQRLLVVFRFLLSPHLSLVYSWFHMKWFQGTLGGLDLTSLTLMTMIKVKTFFQKKISPFAR